MTSVMDFDPKVTISEVRVHARLHLDIQYVSVIAWVFDFQKFIIITDVSLQAMHIACAPIPSFCSQHGITHERLTKYLFPWV